MKVSDERLKEILEYYVELDKLIPATEHSDESVSIVTELIELRGRLSK